MGAVRRAGPMVAWYHRCSGCGLLITARGHDGRPWHYQVSEGRDRYDGSKVLVPKCCGLVERVGLMRGAMR